MTTQIQRNKRLFLTATIASLVGILDAGYLSYEHLWGSGLKCIVGSACSLVTTSVYSEISGIPISVFGFGFYIFMFASLLWMSERRASGLLGFVRVMAGTSFLISLSLVYIQAFVLHAFCPYCMLSAVTSTTIFFCLVFVRYPQDELPATSQA